MIERAAYTVNEFLAAVPISRATFWRRVKAGEIKVVRLGRRTLVPALALAHIRGGDLPRSVETSRDTRKQFPRVGLGLLIPSDT